MDVSNLAQSKKEKKRIYNCTICSKSFKDNYKLKRHERIHVKSGELPEPSEPEIDIGNGDLENIDVKAETENGEKVEEKPVEKVKAKNNVKMAEEFSGF